MAGYIKKIGLDKKRVESNLLMENDECYDEYYALKISDGLYHVYGVNVPRFVMRLDNYDLANNIEKE